MDFNDTPEEAKFRKNVENGLKKMLHIKMNLRLKMMILLMLTK